MHSIDLQNSSTLLLFIILRKVVSFRTVQLSDKVRCFLSANFKLSSVNQTKQISQDIVVSSQKRPLDVDEFSNFSGVSFVGERDVFDPQVYSSIFYYSYLWTPSKFIVRLFGSSIFRHSQTIAGIFFHMSVNLSCA